MSTDQGEIFGQLVSWKEINYEFTETLKNIN